MPDQRLKRAWVTPVCILLSLYTFVNPIALHRLTLLMVLWDYSSVAPQILLKKVKNALVLIRPTDRFHKTMVFYWINGKIPVLLAQLNQPLHQPHGVLEMDVGIHHPMADQQRAFQPLRKIDRRRLFVGFGIFLRQVQNVRGVLMIVVRPIRHGTKRGAGGKNIRLREHRHESDKTTIAAAANPDTRPPHGPM